jgi:hypothetical protein
VEGHGHDSIWDSIWAVWISGLQADIWTGDFPDTRQSATDATARGLQTDMDLKRRTSLGRKPFYWDTPYWCLSAPPAPWMFQNCFLHTKGWRCNLTRSIARQGSVSLPRRLFENRQTASYSLRTFLTYFPYFEGMKVGLWYHHAVCIPQLTFECLNQSLWNLVRISWHLSPSQRRTSQIPPISLCVCMCMHLSLLGNGSVNSLPRQRINSVVLVRKRTITTERPQPVGEVSASFSW